MGSGIDFLGVLISQVYWLDQGDCFSSFLEALVCKEPTSHCLNVGRRTDIFVKIGSPMHLNHLGGSVWFLEMLAGQEASHVSLDDTGGSIFLLDKGFTSPFFVGRID